MARGKKQENEVPQAPLVEVEPLSPEVSSEIDLSIRLDRFLEAYAKDPRITKACEEAGVTLRDVYRRASDDQGFNRALATAREFGYDVMEDAAIERAVFGWLEPVFDKTGCCVGDIRRYSDTLLSQLLKANRRKFRGEDVGMVRGLSDEASRQLARVREEARALE